MLLKNATICILAKDCNKALIHNIPKVEKLRTYFQNSSVIVVENDSTDGTKSTLEYWKNNYNNIHILYPTKLPINQISNNNQFSATGYNRISKMCYLRNFYLDYVEENFPNTDYLIMIDIDIDDFSVDSIITSIELAPTDWIALFANGNYYINFLFKKIALKYYDEYAYVPYSNPVKDLTNKEMHIENDKLWRSLKNHNYLRCDSAFGGIGIYKYNFIRQQRYSIEKNKRSKIIEVLCEHVPYNLNINTKGKLYIVKNMKVFYEKVKTFKAFILFLLGSKRTIYLWEKLKHKKYYD